MTDAYELMERAEDGGRGREGAFDREAWARRKRDEREEVFELADKAARRVNADPTARSGYAAVMAALPGHSATNALLVYAQRPGAKQIGDSAYWSQKRARIKKGERGIVILEPGREYVRDDGSIGNFYDVKKVFDVSQTTARERLGRRASPTDVLTALVMRSPVPIEPQEGPVEGSVRYDAAAGAILVERGLGDKRLLDGLLTEQAHAFLAGGDPSYDRDAHRPQAALAAAVAAMRLGIPAPEGGIPAPAPPGAEPKEIRNALNGARSASADIAARVGEALSKDREHDAPTR